MWSLFFLDMFSAFAQTKSTTTTTRGSVVVCERRRRVATLPRRRNVSVRSAAKGVKEEEDKDDAFVADVFKKIYVPNTGKRIKYGVFQETITEENRAKYTDEEKRRLREEAARDLTVIDAAERKRRGEKTPSFGYIERERESLYFCSFGRFVRSFRIKRKHFMLFYSPRQKSRAHMHTSTTKNRNYRSRVCLGDGTRGSFTSFRFPATGVGAIGAFPDGVLVLRIPRFGTERHVKHSASRRLGRRRGVGGDRG